MFVCVVRRAYTFSSNGFFINHWSKELKKCFPLPQIQKWFHPTEEIESRDKSSKNTRNRVYVTLCFNDLRANQGGALVTILLNIILNQLTKYGASIYNVVLDIAFTSFQWLILQKGRTQKIN